MIDIAAVREAYERSDIDFIGWVPSCQNIANGLTKLGICPTLQRFLESHQLDQEVKTVIDGRFHFVPLSSDEMCSSEEKSPECGFFQKFGINVCCNTVDPGIDVDSSSELMSADRPLKSVLMSVKPIINLGVTSLKNSIINTHVESLGNFSPRSFFDSKSMITGSKKLDCDHEFSNRILCKFKDILAGLEFMSPGNILMEFGAISRMTFPYLMSPTDEFPGHDSMSLPNDMNHVTNEIRSESTVGDSMYTCDHGSRATLPTPPVLDPPPRRDSNSHDLGFDWIIPYTTNNDLVLL